MKPRLFLHDKLWYCMDLRNGGRYGLGYTFAGAYADWVSSNNILRTIDAHKVSA